MKAWQRRARAWLGLQGLAHHVVDEDAPVRVAQIGVLGLAGVGKSSLLNALLTPEMQLLPAGGVGPLTARVVRLGHREELMFRVAYGEGDAAPPPSIHPLLQQGRWLRRREQPSTFHRLLRAHAAGELAPFCREIEVGCPAELLSQGVELVDLPGLGAFADARAMVTLQQLQTLDGLVLVVDRAGLPETVLNALVKSGFLQRWLNGEAQALIAVAKLDEIASSARDSADRRRRWADHLCEVMAEARDFLCHQAKHALARAAGDEALRLFDDPERLIFPVTSHEMGALHRRDGSARVALAESTGVPDLRRALLTLARSQSMGWVPSVTRVLHNASADRASGPELYAEWMNLLDEVSSDS